MFLSTFEKQVDAKRRIVVPQEFRALVSGPFDGIVCFPSIEADCIEGGGRALFDRYIALMDEMPFGDPVRSAIELSVLGGQAKMNFDTAGRKRLLVKVAPIEAASSPAANNRSVPPMNALPSVNARL